MANGFFSKEAGLRARFFRYPGPGPLGSGMAKEARIRELIEPAATALGFEIVRVRLYAGAPRTLQVMAERADGAMAVGDCAALSRAIAPILEIESAVAGEYRLEVSSPGIDRPLTRPKDFTRWAGHEAKLELERPLNGRKRFRGIVRGLEGDTIKVELSDTHETVLLPLADLGEAKLVLTDELLKAAPPVNADEFDAVEVEQTNES
jgi:ribosome maturation factor RimP